MMYRLAIFDLDGTLLNTLDDLAAAGNYALAQGGFPVYGVEAYKRFVGSGVYNLLKRALPLEYRSDDAVLQSLLGHFTAYYTAHGEDQTRPYSGISELLSSLKGQGMSIAVLSNKADKYVPELVHTYFPGLVDKACGQRDDVPMKPAPDGVLYLLEHFQCSASDCVYIGDSDIDMYTGTAAGIAPVGVTWGFRTEEELVQAGASAIVRNVEELRKLLVDNTLPLRYTK